jgi:hypothetical protein
MLIRFIISFFGEREVYLSEVECHLFSREGIFITEINV